MIGGDLLWPLGCFLVSLFLSSLCDLMNFLVVCFYLSFIYEIYKIKYLCYSSDYSELSAQCLCLVHGCW